MSDNFVENFTEVGDIVSNYEGTSEADLKDAVIHLAWYGYGSYSGDSLVIYEKNGVLYEVNGSHCSCFGLEGQWQPEETTWAALAMRDLNSGYYDGESKAQEILTALIDEKTGGVN